MQYVFQLRIGLLLLVVSVRDLNQHGDCRETFRRRLLRNLTWHNQITVRLIGSFAEIGKQLVVEEQQLQFARKRSTGNGVFRSVVVLATVVQQHVIQRVLRGVLLDR